MPSLSSTTGSASSLLRSASSLQNSIQAYQDSLEAYKYENSAYTDEAYAGYKTYLEGRIKSLNDAGGVANAQKALTLTRTLESAMKSNISGSIQRENIAIMSGNASLSDKYSLVASQFSRAMSAGNLTLAQSLESQAYSISQSIQYQAQQAAASAKTLANAGARSQDDVASKLEAQLKQFNSDIKTVGQKSYQSTVNQFVKSIKPQLDALHVVLPEGATPNVFDVTEGIVHAIYLAHSYAAQAVETSDPETAQKYADKANAIVNGTTTFQTVSGNLSLQEIQQSANELAAGHLAYNETTGGFGKKALDTLPGTTASGFKYVPGKGVQLTASANAFQAPDSKMGADLTNLGLQYSGKQSDVQNGIQVQVTDKSPDFLRKYIPTGSLLNVFTVWNPTTKSNMYQFKGDASQGPGSSVYSIVSDASGKRALAEEGPTGSIIHGGDYGYNSSPPGVSSEGHGWFSNAAHNLLSGISGAAGSIFGLFGGKAYAQSLVQQSQLAQANAIAAQAMLALKAPPLPQISLAPASQPKPITINQAKSPPVASYPVAPRTINPQTPSGITYQGGAIPLQGGSVDLMAGSGTGIRL